MSHTKSTRWAVWVILSLLISPLWAAEPQYFARVGSGRLPNSDFRTQFRLLNARTAALEGTLSFFSAAGEGMTPELRAEWSPTEGTVTTDGNRVDFTVPAGSLLRLTLVPEETVQVGWASLNCPSELKVQAFFQFARTSPGENPAFEDALIREVEVLPLEGLHTANFPLSFFLGNQHLNTALALVNLSAVPASVTLTQLPDLTRTVTVEPGQLFSGYMDEVFPQPLIAYVPPLHIEALAEVVSPVPIALVVIRTLQGFPLSGVRVAPSAPAEETISGQLGEEVQLALRQTVRFEEEDLEVTFWDVTEDSRCPIGVLCVWAGRARTIIRVRQQGTDRGELELAVSGQEPQQGEEGQIGEYRIEATRVDPYPHIDEGPIEASRYRLTLVVTRADES